MTEPETRKRLTGLRYNWFWEPPPEDRQPRLASLPADGVILGISIRGLAAVNARHGSPMGNEVLAEFARRLYEGVRPWTAYRDGVDDFIVSARLGGDAAIRAFVEPIQASLERPYDWISVGTSVVAAMAVLGQPASELLEGVGRGLDYLKATGSSELLILQPGSRPLAS